MVGVDVQIETDLFERLAHRGRGEVAITRIVTTARKGHVAGPRITRILRAADEERFDSGVVLLTYRPAG